MDFTLSLFRSFLAILRDSGYSFITIREYSGIKHPEHYPAVVLRHDVDKRPESSLETARIENDLGLRGTYYFRIVPESYNMKIINEIASLGHEIGYHYEDMDLARQKVKDKSRKSKVESRNAGSNREEELAEIAIESFRGNLTKLSHIVPIDTICMHGSPMSPVDNRMLWKYYDYSSFGIIAEPYFDFSLEDILYLTDTGRRWDGSSVSVRDRVYARDDGYYSGWMKKPLPGSAMLMTGRSVDLQRQYRFRGTESIINAVRSQKMHERMMITFHPQRWSKSFPEWMTELLTQNIKNPVKLLVNRHRITEKI